MCIDKIRLNTYNLTFVDINSIVSACEVDIIDDLYQYQLLDNLKFNNIDTKKVFYYYIIKKVCDILINSKDSNKIVFWFNDQGPGECDILQYTSQSRLNAFIQTVFKKLRAFFPVKFYTSEIEFEEFRRIVTDDPGALREIVQNVHEAMKKFKIESYTFSKVRQFINNYELTYLDNHYFNQVKVKAIMYK
jgi:hypothetical protein